MIIGGTSGIGLETARYLQTNGEAVVICGRHNPQADIAYEYIDVADERSIEQVFKGVVSLQGLVYAAGIATAKKPITQFEARDWHRILNVNVTGALLVLKYAYQSLAASRGRVVIVNSIAARSTSSLSGVEYTMTKYALSGMVRQLSGEFARNGIAINSVFPSMTATQMLLDNVSQEKLNEIVADIPLGRLASPLDTAKAIAFLLSDSSDYLCGSGLDINGGQYLTG